MGSVCEVYWTRIPRRSWRFRSQWRACSKTWIHPRITSARRSERKANSFLRNSLPGTAQKSFGGGGESVLGPGSAYNQGRERRREGKELQARTGGAGQGFRDDGDAVPRFDGGDEAADAVMFLRDTGLAVHGCKHGRQMFVSLGIILAAVGDQRLRRGLRQSHRAPPGQRMFWRHRQADGIARQLLESQSAQHGGGQAHHEGDLEFAFAQPGDHFLSGKIVQSNTHVGRLGLESAQRLWQNSRGKRGRVTNVEFPGPDMGNVPRRFNRVFGALQDRAGFRHERPARFGQADGLRGAFPTSEDASIPFGHAETRNMVFPRFKVRVASYGHDENTKSKRTGPRGTRVAGHISHLQLRGLLRSAMDGLPRPARD